ncbi:unnamed protein product [Trifolium pratense]|uniref:Uncharacterized protein n=1 Tax=Trifolium pratense TaxID=57577 RepID=A0ACB0J283_TRIPR|nr:unnamed protein product [Trifolium pratense]
MPKLFSDNAREFGYKFLILEGPKMTSTKLHLDIPSNVSERIKIKRGWKNYCYDNDIKLGDRLKFEFLEFRVNPFGELEPTFINQIAHELDEEIILINRYLSARLPVKFNCSLTKPMITEGWEEMRKLFGIEGNQLVTLTYAGFKRFIVDVHSGELNPNEMPQFHSFKFEDNEPLSFSVRLTDYEATKCQLTLNKEFGEYVRTTGYDQVMLCGPNDTPIATKIIKYKVRWYYTVKFGSQWRKFVSTNGFVSGDVLNFMFIDKERSNVMRVVKLED